MITLGKPANAVCTQSWPAQAGVGRIKRLLGPILVLLTCLLAADAYPESKSAQYKEYEVKAAFMYNFLKFVDWPEGKIASNGNQIIIGIIGQDPFGSAADILKDKKVEDRNVVIKRFDGFQQLKEAVGKDKTELTNKIKALSKSQIIYRDNDGKIVIKPADEFEELKGITDGAAREKKIEELKKRGFMLVDPSKAEDTKTIIDTIANGQMETLKRCYLLFICPSEKNNINEIIDLVKNQSVLTVADTQEFLDAGGIVNFVIEDNKVRFDVNLTASEKAGLKIRSQLLRLAKKVVKDGVDVTSHNNAVQQEAK
jgi:bifunctional DNA-binding transcriptional regulator/antitoxin component of YhaV-PrlF toxin-antitoxin module